MDTTALLVELDKHFRFHVGDRVTMIQGGVSFEDMMMGLRSPIKLVIIERVLRQCSGGVQPTYVLRLFNQQGASAYTEFHENELMWWADAKIEYDEARKKARDDK